MTVVLTPDEIRLLIELCDDAQGPIVNRPLLPYTRKKLADALKEQTPHA
jgi:hypothetical protein